MRVSDASAVMAATGDGGDAETREPGRRICFLTSNFPRWEGDSTTPFVLHLAQDLAAEGWEVEVLAPHAPGAAGHEILGGIAVTRFRYLWPETAESVCYQGGALINLRRNPLNWLKLPALVAAEAIALWRLARRRRYDLIHAHWILPQGWVGVLVGRSLGIPCLITVHGGDIFALGGRLLGAFKRYALTRAAAVTVNSSATEAAVRAVAPGIPELRRIPMGARVPGPPDADAVREIRARYAPGGEPLLVFVGRLVEEKGVGDLLRALARLRAEGCDAHLMLLGEGQERARFEAQAVELGLAEAAHFLGWIAPEEVPAYLAAADLFVTPSRTEGQGLTIAEAQLAGLPVIATGVGGVVDVVRDGETGLLVAEASPPEIASAVTALCHDPALHARLGEQGRAHAEAHFTRAHTTSSFGEVFALLLDAAGKSEPLWANRRRADAGPRRGRAAPKVPEAAVRRSYPPSGREEGDMTARGNGMPATSERGSSVEAGIRQFYDREGWSSDEGDTFADTRRWGATLPSHKAHGRQVVGDMKALFEGGGTFYLNCGCGPFTDTAMAVSGGYRRRVCIDLSERALEICRNKLGSQGIYLCGSMIYLPVPESLADGTLCEHVLYHVEKSEQERAVRELIRVTKPGAPIVIIYSNPSSPLNTIENFLLFFGITKLLGGKKLYFFRWPLRWWHRFTDECEIEIRPFEPISARQASVLLRNERVGRLFFRFCRWLEVKWPGLAVRLWSYPMIVLTKRIGEPDVSEGRFLERRVAMANVGEHGGRRS